MKKMILFLVFVLSSFAYAGQNILESSANESIENGRQHLPLLDDSLTRKGIVGIDELINKYPEFKHSYNKYIPSDQDIKTIQELAGMKVMVFFGLWCHDSYREVSHLLKLAQVAGNPFDSIELIALNVRKEMPIEYAEIFDVKKTPTIFVINENKIVAQIIETSRGTIAQDLYKQISISQPKSD